VRHCRRQNKNIQGAFEDLNEVLKISGEMKLYKASAFLMRAKLYFTKWIIVMEMQWIINHQMSI